MIISDPHPSLLLHVKFTREETAYLKQLGYALRDVEELESDWPIALFKTLFTLGGPFDPLEIKRRLCEALLPLDGHHLVIEVEVDEVVTH